MLSGTRTVDSHLGRAYAKLGVANRTALAAVLSTTVEPAAPAETRAETTGGDPVS